MFEFLELPENVQVLDVILIGSNANYNWTDTSDIDLHVVINYQGRQVTHEQKIERATQNYLLILRQLETARGTDNEGRIQTLVTNSFNRLNTLFASDPANNDMMMML